MKDKILYLILGILIGAVITAGCFLVFAKAQTPQMRGDKRPDMSNMSEKDLENLRNQKPEDVPDLPNSSNTVENNPDVTTTE